ncbi:prepilin peptidase [Kutzneria chonburiensis]|uniref:Prepilin peptidase n=1 Tax=Kutzneria chonburiensis TaxID=1483604 RepID=A0ABV6N5L4_9PSEU|nr:A24 family peptidase [Kutzneria chonburiensis]
MFALLAWKFSTDLAVLAPSWLAAAGLPLTVLDLRQRRLPNWLVLPAYPVVIGFVAVDAAVSCEPWSLVRSIAGMAIFAIFVGVLYWIFGNRQGVGGGDIKLAGVVGAVLGQSGWGPFSTGMVASWFLAAIVLLPLRVLHAADEKTDMAFDPFLLAGAGVTLLIP